MFTCISLFISMFTMVFGISLMLIIPGAVDVNLFGVGPMPLVVMGIGLGVSVILLLIIRSVGDSLDLGDQKTVANLCRFFIFLGFVAGVIMCVLQIGLRLKFNEWGFFAMPENVSIIDGATMKDKTSVFFMTVLALFLGLPIFFFVFIGADFDRYVTITTTHLSDGTSYESNRSESFIPVTGFIFLGLLTTIPFVALSGSILTYLFMGVYGALLFGLKSKKTLKVTAIIFAIITLALVVFTLAPTFFGITYNV